MIDVDTIRSVVESCTRRDRSHLLRGIVHVTDLTTCLRKAFFDTVLGYRATKVMEVGASLHNEYLPAICSKLSEMGHRCVYEVTVTRTVNGRCMRVTLVGRIDAVIDDSVILELKFSNRIKPHHVLQCEYYSWITGIYRFVICVVKDSGDVECREYTRSRSDEELMKRIDDLTCAVIDGSPPKPERGEWCRFCPHRPVCAAGRKLTDYVL